MPWLHAIVAEDMSFTLAQGVDFDAPQEMTEEFRQVVGFRGALGHRGAVMKNKRPDDSATFSFSAVLVRNPSTGKLYAEKDLKEMENFTVQVRRGKNRDGTDIIRTYHGCEWTRISVRSTQDEGRLDADIMIPGYYNEHTE